MNNELKKEIIQIVAKIIKIPADKIDSQANLFTDLGVDSLLGVEIFASLDKKYNLNVPEEKLRDVTSVNDLVNLVESMLPKK
jgi:acyl carrier protein